MGETVSFLRAPDAGDPHVRCDEREQETEPRQTGLRRRSENCAKGHREATATAPVLDSTQVFINESAVAPEVVMGKRCGVREMG